MTNRNAYIIPLVDIDLSRILKTWTWLVGENKTVIALTKIGDALLKDSEDKLYFLNTGVGDFKILCENYLDFINGKLDNKIYEEVLLPALVNKLEKSNKALKPNKSMLFINYHWLVGIMIKTIFMQLISTSITT
jgi:hypothetical protein